MGDSALGDAGLGDAGLDGPAGDGPISAFLRVLADGADGATVGAALADGLLRAYAPSRLSAYFVVDGGAWLEERVRFGVPSADGEYARVQATTPMPLTEVFRTGESGAWTSEEAAEAFPVVAGWVQAHPETRGEEHFGVPIRGQGRVLGAMLVSLPEGSERSWRLRLLLESAASGLALWSLAAPASAARARRGRSRGSSVSPRQRAIVDGVRRGLSNAGIAAELGVSVGTVKADLAQLFRTFAVSERTELVRLVPKPRR
ncbi:MAG: helix-turn-helix transcriptional regulator [Actinobacteria bacterium]|nr:helix-turn-helix transcriptional regulator [Actinomycetota bacterium]